jgi:hypothetical protein
MEILLAKKQTTIPGHNVATLFTAVIYVISWSVCLRQACPAKSNTVRLEPTQVKHLSAAPPLVRFLALPTNIRPGWKGLPGKNTTKQVL